MKKFELEPEKLTGPQKAAVFLLSMGEDYATKAFSKMSETEIKHVASAMARIDHITPEVMEIVFKEFGEKFEGQMSKIIEGENFLRRTLERALDSDAAETIFSDLDAAKREIPFDWSRKVDVSTLSNYISTEHPQTIAMILAHLPSDIGAEVIMTLPEEKRGDIAMRIAHLGQVPDEIVRDVDTALRSELSRMSGSGGKVGGLQVLVDIMNSVDKATEEVVMEFIGNENPDMATDIRSMMFVFEDLIRVDDRGMREILKKVETPQLTLALKTASEEMKQKIMGNLSQRAAEMILEDLAVMGPVKLSEVEEAQQAIINAAKELEADGTLSLGGKGKEDMLV
ncbi:MAG: flagellar motor switch protein FliG [Desulfobacterales bacterium]|nr:flagellar motor switch protein FliG [Desulfobacterales bacterium]